MSKHSITIFGAEKWKWAGVSFDGTAHAHNIHLGHLLFVTGFNWNTKKRNGILEWQRLFGLLRGNCNV